MIELVKNNTNNIALEDAKEGLTLVDNIKTIKGKDGGYYVPYVDSNGVLTWLPSKEDMPTVEAVNIKGQDGEKGKDGYTPVKGIDYFDGDKGDTGADGYTPIKGIDYFDGAKGEKGEKGDTGAQGEKGLDGVSVTHSWSGTTLTITSASGTSFADLKGEKGDKGTDGYTPIKGVDYFDGAKGDKGEKGDTGAQGPQGLTGPQGEPGANGKDYVLTSADKEEIAGMIGAVPTYIMTEAKEVADKVIENRTPNSLVLLMATDIHEIASEPDSHLVYKKATTDLGLGMAEVRKYINADAIALLGDYVYDVEPLDKELGKEAIKSVIKKMYDATNDITSIWLDGNHDYYDCSAEGKEYRLTDNIHYALIGANNSSNTNVDLDNIIRNYGYVDFDKQRIRLIYLNTTDISGDLYSPNFISNEQGQWLINTALNMSDKEDEDKWGVVLCSHFPIYATNFIALKNILCAYKDKSTGSEYETTYDFTGVKAELIATFHGHIHNFKVTDVATPKGEVIKAICIPNACINRENPYTGDFQETDANGVAVSYPKTTGTAESTSFNAVVINKDAKTVYAICYGAGYDRTINYGETEAPPVVVIVNRIPLSTDASGAIYNGTGYKDGIRLGSDGTDRTNAATDATGFIPCVKGDKLYFKNCEIKVGTGVQYNEIVYYAADKTYVAKSYIYQEIALTQSTIEMDSNNNLISFDTSEIPKDFAFVRITGNYIGADSIITVNQKID